MNKFMCLHKLGGNNHDTFSCAYKYKIIPAVLSEWDPVSWALFVSRPTRNLHSCYICSTKLPHALCVHTLHYLIEVAINKSVPFHTIYSADLHTFFFLLNMWKSADSIWAFLWVAETMWSLNSFVRVWERELIEYSLLKKPEDFSLFQ